MVCKVCESCGQKIKGSSYGRGRQAKNPKPRQSKHPMTEREQQMIDKYKEGLTLQKIGDEFGVTRERVRQLISKHGVKRVDGGLHINATISMIEKAKEVSSKREAKCWAKYGCGTDEFRELNHGLTRSVVGSPVMGFVHQRNNARRRGIEWNMTFAQWKRFWDASGRWAERGLGLGKYCMSRKMDSGPYELGNVHIITCEDNTREYQARLKRDGILAADGIKRLPESDVLLISDMPIKAGKPLCVRGHPRTPDNLHKGGGCKLCQRIRGREYYLRRKA